jgi:hypothetical protein
VAHGAPRGQVAHLGGRRWHTEEASGGRLDLWTRLGQGREKTQGHKNLWKRKGVVTFWVISFHVYSPWPSNTWSGNMVENVSCLGELPRFWPKRSEKVKSNRAIMFLVI